MPRKKKQQNENQNQSQNLANITPQQIVDIIESDKEDFTVDPDNKYGMPDEQKAFVKYYCIYRSIPLATQLSHIDSDTAITYFSSYSTQQEIRRIFRMMTHRQFKTKMLSIADCGAYLSSLITGENVLEADKLSTKEKLQVIGMIINLNMNMKEAFINPAKLTNADIETQLKTLSVDTIRNMINTETDNNKKQEIISKLNIDGALSMEETNYLMTLSVDELMSILQSFEKK